MTRHAFMPDGYLPWPERCPVLGPLAGTALALSGTIAGVIEGDWMAATVFVIPVVILAVVAERNRKFQHARDPSEVIRAGGMTPSDRSDATNG